MTDPIQRYTPAEHRLIQGRISKAIDAGDDPRSDWPECSVNGCQTKCCIPSLKCYPHNTDEEVSILELAPRCKKSGCCFAQGHMPPHATLEMYER